MRAIVNYDPSAPTVDWNSPTSDRWLRGSIPLQVVGRDDLSGVDHFALTLGAGTVVSSADGAATLDTTGLPDGPHALTATAVDRAGNRSEVATRSVRIDNGAPLVSLDAPAPATLVSGSLALAASAADSGSGVAQVRFELRPATGGAWQPLAADGDAPYRVVSAALAGDGPYEVRAVAADAVGNEASAPATAIVIDRTAPTASLDSLAASVSGTITLAATASDPGSGVARVEFQVARPAPTRGSRSPASTRHRGRRASPPPTCPTASMRFECWCAIERATSSRPSVRSTTVRNALESRAGVTAAIAGAGKKAVVLRALALPRRVEGGRSIVVRGQASGVSRGLVTLIAAGLPPAKARPARPCHHPRERHIPGVAAAALLGTGAHRVRR